MMQDLSITAVYGLILAACALGQASDFQEFKHPQQEHGTAPNSAGAFASTAQNAGATWRTGQVEPNLVRYGNSQRRLFHSLAPEPQWDGVEKFLRKFDARIISAVSNAHLTLEFNYLPSPNAIDVSFRFLHTGMHFKLMLSRLSSCNASLATGEVDNETGARDCMGFQHSPIWPGMQRWFLRLLQEGDPKTGALRYWRATWLEHDMGPDHSVKHLPAIFLETHSRPTGRRLADDAVDGINAYLKTHNQRLTPQHAANVAAIVSTAEDGYGVTLWMCAVFHSRIRRGGVGAMGDIEAVRLVLIFRPRRIDPEADAPPAGSSESSSSSKHHAAKSKTVRIVQDMSEFLEKMRWPGDIDEFERIDDYVENVESGLTLHVDVTPSADPEALLGPTVGVDVPLHTPRENAAKLSMLRYMAEDGLADPEWWRTMEETLCYPPRDDLGGKKGTRQSRMVVQLREGENNEDQPSCEFIPNAKADQVESHAIFLNDEKPIHSPVSVDLSHIKFVVKGGSSLFSKVYVNSLPGGTTFAFGLK